VARVVKVKKRCCQSRPRCKRCPLALKRLERAGLADRLDKRTWQIGKRAKKKDLKRARSA
jgi:hypothetical protein